MISLAIRAFPVAGTSQRQEDWVSTRVSRLKVVIARVSGHGLPLVAIHGFGVDHRIMLPLEEFVDSAWQRIYIDLPWAEGSVGGHAASADEVAHGALTDILDHLGNRPFAIIGNSFGGMIARFVAHELRDQVLGLATLAGVYEPFHPARNLPARQVITGNSSVLHAADEARDEYAAMTVVQTQATLDAFKKFALPGLRGANQAVIEQVATAYGLSLEPELVHPAPFEAPSLHLFGRQDHVTGYEDGWKLRRHYVRGTYAVLDAAGHNAHLERPALTAALINDWLSRAHSHSLQPVP